MKYLSMINGVSNYSAVIFWLLFPLLATAETAEEESDIGIEEQKPQFRESFVVQDENFGRLFTTREQRDYIDRHRKNNRSEGNVEPVKLMGEVQQDVNQTNPEVRLSGVVIREDGNNMVWLNGQSELSRAGAAKKTKAQASKPQAGSISVSVHSQQRSARLKPGQVWLLDERRVEEAYRLKSISVVEPVTATDTGKKVDDVPADENDAESES